MSKLKMECEKKSEFSSARYTLSQVTYRLLKHGKWILKQTKLKME